MQTIILTEPNDANQRIDKFLKKFFPNLPLGALYKMLRTGKIRVNDQKIQQNHRLELNDTITFLVDPGEMVEWKMEQKKQETPPKEEKSFFDILYQDEYLLILNKPAGVNVHPWDHKTDEVSLIERVHDFLGEKYRSLTFRPALVHRIDRDTSGCIMIALEKWMLESLLSQIQSHSLKKVYHAVTIGSPPQRQWTFREKLSRRENAKNQAKVVVDEDLWQKAVTHYRLLKSVLLFDQKCSLLECLLETGRTHQIRVHLSYNNCPILWDKSYWDKKMNAFFARHCEIHRQLLHAESLTFFHPYLKKYCTIRAPYFPDFQKVLS